MKKLLSLLLAVLMVISLLPTVAFAEDGHPENDHEGWTEWTTTDNLPDEAGNYYLANDVNLTETWNVPTGETNLCLNGHVIKLADGKTGGVIKVGSSNITLNLYDCDTKTKHYFEVGTDGLWVLTDNNTETYVTGGVITGGNKKSDGPGGGVYVDSGTFTMNGGTICGNIAQTAGGGVYVYSGKFTMENGTICGNIAQNGGGVSVYYGTFTMENGTICGNNVSSLSGNSDGGGVYVNGTFTMNGGSICENTAFRYGGGVCVASGNFTMKDGTICDNTADYDGGGVEVYSGSFTIMSGTISGNTAANHGGGVYVTSGNFTMKDGTISGNTAKYGGGIQNGGGIMKLTADEGKTVTVTKNTATDAEGGIANWYTMHLSGKVIIKDNICDKKYSDTNYPINLATKNPITVGDALTGSEIYITHADSGSDEHDTGVLTSGFTTNNPDAKLGDFFRYDGPIGFYMSLDESGELEVKKVPADSYRIDIVDCENGSVTADKIIASAAEIVTLTITPDDGYQLKTLKYNDGTDHDITKDATTGNYQFAMPAADVAVTAEFERVFCINYEASDGNVSYEALPESTLPVKATPGTLIRFNVTTTDGYEIASVSCSVSEGNPVEVKKEDGYYSFVMPEDDVTIAAEAVKTQSEPERPFFPKRKQSDSDSRIVIGGKTAETNETNPDTGAPVMNFGAIAVVLGAAYVLSKKH